MTKNIFVAEVTFNVTYTERVKKMPYPYLNFLLNILKQNQSFQVFSSYFLNSFERKIFFML